MIADFSGRFIVKDGAEEFAVTQKNGKTIIEMPNNYICTIFIMTSEEYHQAVEMYGDKVILLDRAGSICFVVVTEDTKDSLTCIREIRFETGRK